MIWTEEIQNYLIDKWQAGYSASECVGLINKKFPVESFCLTRSAVMGKLWRMGIINDGHHKKIAMHREQKHKTEYGEWLKANYKPDMDTIGEIADRFNAHFGINHSRPNIRNYLIRLGIYQQKSNKAKSKPASRLPDALKRIALPQEQPSEAISMEVAGRDACRWPMNDDASLVCGKQISRGSFCAHHADMAYVKPIKRKEADTYMPRRMLRAYR